MNEKMTPEELEKFIHRELRALPPRKAPAGFEARLQAAVEARAVRPADSPEQLEQLVHRGLRGLPLRRAPRTLEARVLAEIERRATIAWYHKSWSYWPAPVKAAFATISTGLIAAVVVGLTFLGRAPQADALSHQIGERVQGVSSLLSLGTWAVEFTGRLLGSIPPLWLYSGIAVIAALYATFLGLGAFAYRTLYRTN
jgi:hypothetical protein